MKIDDVFFMYWQLQHHCDNDIDILNSIDGENEHID